MKKPSPSKSLTMPSVFPANPVWGDQRTIHYKENTVLSISYRTDRKAVVPYLPKGFTVPENPLMTVNFVMCRGVKEMACRGYNLVDVGVFGRYEGEKDRQDGTFYFVIWENQFPPVMIGREILGYPKLVVDIPDAWMTEGGYGWRVSENGTAFLEGEITDMKKLGAKECKAINAESVSDFGSGNLHMTWKCFSGPGYDDPPIAAHMVGVVDHATFAEAWACEGSLKWLPVTPENCYLCYGIITALSKMPIVKYETCCVMRGEHIIEMGKSRRLY